MLAGFTQKNLFEDGSFLFKRFLVQNKGVKANAKMDYLIREVPEVRELVAKRQTAKAEMGKKIYGTPAAEFNEGVQKLLDKMEAWLNGGNQFLVGQHYSLADVLGTVLCGRVHMLKGESMFGPNVSAYFKRMEQRPSFHKTPIYKDFSGQWEERYVAYRNQVCMTAVVVAAALGTAAYYIKKNMK